MPLKTTSMMAILSSTFAFIALQFLIGFWQLAYADLDSIAKVAVGASHACALTTAGGIRCWGAGISVGDGTGISGINPVNVVGMTSGVSAITANGQHSCAVTTSGGVRCWGFNYYGQLGDNSGGVGAIYRLSPVDVLGLTTGVIQVSAGSYHTCAVTVAGGAKCWGEGSQGRLGNGSNFPSYIPVNVTSLTSGVSTISAGGSHTCALTTAGGAKCWGWNQFGQIGDGTTSDKNTPRDVTGLAAGIAKISAGESHTCALNTAGAVKCWGVNDNGQLGDGTTSQRNTPTDVLGLPANISAIFAGFYNSCALQSTGELWCWGWNKDGINGDGTTVDSSTPVMVSGVVNVASAALARDSVCVSLGNGRVVCWGDNSAGQLGNGTYANVYLPVSVDSLSSGMLSINAGSSHTCALTSLGGLQCWGNNYRGQLGDGTNYNRYTPVEVFGLSTGVVAISAGQMHSCALTTLGAAKCWGSNSSGQLGDGTFASPNTATDIVGLSTGVIAINTGEAHTCALTTIGSAKCWGSNAAGRLGDGTTLTRTSPVDVVGLTSGWTAIAAGDGHTCAHNTVGTMKCWGRNSAGQLGNGTTATSSSPVDVIGLESGIVKIDLGYNHSCAVTTGGALRCWGDNTYGQLGDGTTTARSVPTNVLGMSEGVANISTGNNHTCALLTSGDLTCWGDNARGQLGDGTQTQRLIPVTVATLAPQIASVSAGGQHTCAITTAGEAKCWGANNYRLSAGAPPYGGGQLGIAPVAKYYVKVGYSVQGIVRLSGAAMSGVTLRADSMGPAYRTLESTSDIAGEFSLGLTEGVAYNITPALTGYSFSPTNITGNISGDVSQDFVATLNTYSISGVIRGSGQLLAGATVDADALGVQTTDVNGAYAFSGVSHGTAYTLSVSHSETTFGTNTASGTLTANTAHDFAGTLNTYNVTGTITAGGNPLAGVTISGGAIGDAISDSNGDYSIDSVNYGTSYTLTPSLAGYTFLPTSASGTLAGNTSHDFTAELATTTTTSSTVVSTSVPPTSSSASTTLASTTSTPITSTLATSTLASSSSIIPTISSTIVSSSTTSSVAVTTSPSTSTILDDTGNIDTDGDGLTNAEEESLGTDPENSDGDADGVSDGEEVQAGTNPKDPGSKAPKLSNTLCSEWNGYLSSPGGNGMYNIMEHSNLTTKKLRVKTELRSIRGHLKSTYEFFLRGHQQFDLLVHDMGGRELNSYGQVCSTYTLSPNTLSHAGSLDGRMVYYKFATNGSIEFAFAFPFENPLVGNSTLIFNTHQPSLAPEDANNLVANWVQLSNVSRKRLKGKLYYHSLNGTALGKAVEVNLRDGARYDYSAHSHGQNIGGIVRFVPIDKAVEYQLRAVRYLYDNDGSVNSFASAYPFDAMLGSGETLISPIDTRESSSVLELANTLSTELSVRVKVYEKSGKSRVYSKAHALKPYSTFQLPLDVILPNSTGVVSAKGARVGSIIANVVNYGRKPNTGIRNMYAIPLRQPMGSTLKGSYNTYLNQGCLLYIANAADTKENVRLSAMRNDGNKAMADVSLAIPARGMLAEDLCSKLGTNSYGTVTIQATKPNRVYGVILRQGAEERYRIVTALR